MKIWQQDLWQGWARKEVPRTRRQEKNEETLSNSYWHHKRDKKVAYFMGEFKEKGKSCWFNFKNRKSSPPGQSVMPDRVVGSILDF